MFEPAERGRKDWPESVMNGLAPFAGLPTPLRDELGAICVHRSFARDAQVADESDHLDYVGFITAGIFRMTRVQPGHDDQVVGLLAEGDMFGRIFNGPLHFSIEAASDAEVCVFPRAPFEDLAGRWPELERMVILNILNELDAARERMLLLDRHRVSERLAGFLLLLCRRWPELAQVAALPDGTLNLTVPIDRRDLARFLATRRDSLSRAFHQLADDGLIRLNAPQKVDLLDPQRLSDLSGSTETLGPDFWGPAAFRARGTGS
jgi:CRP/FNR family transcriptional regulator